MFWRGGLAPKEGAVSAAPKTVSATANVTVVSMDESDF